MIDGLTLAHGGNYRFSAPQGGMYTKHLIHGALAGSGNITLNTNLGLGKGDQMIAQETAGAHTLYINNTGGAPASTGQALKIIDVINPAKSSATFTLSGGMWIQALSGIPGKGSLCPGRCATPLGDAGDWYLFNQLSASGAPILSSLSQQALTMSSALKYTTVASLNNLHKRLGELRFDDNHQGDLWARTYHKEYENRINPGI